MKQYKSGSKPRYDDLGSEFGDVHRELPKSFGMFDIDYLEGNINFNVTMRKQDTGFIEYCVNWDSSEVHFKALFEIKYKKTKYSLDALNCKKGTSSYAQLHLCKKLGCDFFIVYATEGNQPFDFYKIVEDGSNIFMGTLDYNVDNKELQIKKFWKKIGLYEKR